MSKNKRRLFVDSALLIVSYFFLTTLWYLALQSILIPYDGTTFDTRPPEGFIRTMNDFFEKHDTLTLIPLAFLLGGSLSLFWHRISKRKESLDHVIQHTYVTNFFYFFFKLFLLLLIPFLPRGKEFEWYRALYEIYIIIFVHITSIFILFFVHHKNITFRKKLKK